MSESFAVFKQFHQTAWIEFNKQDLTIATNDHQALCSRLDNCTTDNVVDYPRFEQNGAVRDTIDKQLAIFGRYHGDLKWLATRWRARRVNGGANN